MRQKLDRLATACTAGDSAFGYLTLQRIQEKNSNSRTCGIREWEDKSSFPMNPYALESWKIAKAPFFSERWRTGKSAEQKSSLPDVRLKSLCT